VSAILVLWDIDHTLIENHVWGHGPGEPAYRTAGVGEENGCGLAILGPLSPVGRYAADARLGRQPRAGS
jgi:hypothetical protein